MNETTINETAINECEIPEKSGGAELSEAKRRLLQQYLSNGEGKNRAEQARINPRPYGELAPLSFAQQQVWLHGQMTGDVPFYNEPITIYRRGPLDLAVLQRCLLEIIRRHEIWRTTFEVVAGAPVQVAHPAPVTFPLPFIDLHELPGAEREAEAKRLATVDARRPFDLKTGPLVRALLVRTGEEEHRLYLTVHQIVFDAVTVYRVLLPELAKLYEAFAAGLPSPLPELRVQYADFAYWQRRKLSAGVWSEHMAYWRKQLAGELPVLEWPNDHPRPPIETHRGAIQRFTLPPSLVQTLRELSQRYGASFYMTLLAAMAALLYRYTGQEDIILGSFTAGRKLAEVEPLLGYFVNPLPLRIDLSGNPTFRELQSRVRGVLLDALSHDDVPFVHIVSEIQYTPDRSRNPLFQVVLSQQPKLSNIPGWELATEEICNGGSKLDLVIVVDDRGENVFGPIIYNPDLFDATTITRMIGHWQTLLMAAAADSEKRIAELPILTDAERQQISIEWNNTQAECPNLCAHELIEAQARRTPDAIAIMCEDEQVSYRELNGRANQLAHHLRKLGVGPEVLVGICLERSIAMMVGLLGILKAGGAYVPLDPAYPKARLTFMIEDSGLRFLVTEESLETKLGDCGGKLICVDRDWSAISQESKENPSTRVEPENLAYVIYTSGSTGRPKGVQVSHHALVNFLASMRLWPGLAQPDSLLAVTTISFDIAALELYLPLTVGARCVIASREAAADGQQLQSLLEDHQITVMQATPSTWKLLLQESGWVGKGNLKILCGGEAMPRELAEQLIAKAASVWNMYGPTETTVWSTAYPIISCEGPILIGRPIANTEIYILDRNLQAVPAGIIGELYIGGDGLARGYLNRPELDAEKFILNPLNPEAGARLYRTGDLARYRADGNIECLGRVDHQVKVRGFRIELGEIESLLREHQAVCDACVIVREDLPGGLAAYVILAEGQASNLDEIRNFLKEKLPGYMVPILCSLEKFPLTPNGKLDRRALPAPENTDFGHEETAEELNDPTERMLAGIWSDVLKIPRVSVYDNFFDLGGHSLLATQVVGRIEKDLGVRMKLKELAFQTLGQFAASCRERLERQ